MVLAADGRRVAGFGEGHGIDSDRSGHRAAVHERGPRAGLLSTSADGTKPVVHFVAPVVGRASAPAVGAVLLTADPESWLYPFLRHQAVLSDTAETVLVQKEGDDVVFLTPLRHSAAKPLTFRRPLSTPGFAAAAAFAGREEFTEYVDYRGASVFATARRIRGTPWGLVVKVDRDEALAEYRRWLAGALAGLGLALLAAGGLGYGAWHRGRLLVARGGRRERAAPRRAGQRGEQRGVRALGRRQGAAGEPAGRGAVRVLGGRTARDDRGRPARPGTREAPWRSLRQAAEGGLVVVETVHRRRDGSAFPVEVSIHHADVQGERFLLTPSAT